MRMATEKRSGKVRTGRLYNYTVFSSPLLFFAFFFLTKQAFSLFNRATPICYLMASSLLVRFPICGQTVPLPHSAEQENNIHSLTQILGDRSCSRATKNELLLSQVWTFALKPAFDETFLWISTLLFIAGQSARSLWLRPFVLYSGIILIYVVVSHFPLEASASALFSKPNNTSNDL